MRLRTKVAVPSFLLAAALATSAHGADQTIRGVKLIVKDQDPSTTSRRSVVAVAKEAASPNTIVGDPLTGGARLEVVANGTTPSAQVFPLPQGTAADGSAFWSATGTRGFRYVDRRGEQGPVRSVLVKRGGAGAFTLKAKLVSGPWPVDVVPPDAGTDGFVTLTLGGGDRYCVQYGADGTNANRGGVAWRNRHPVAEGCPALEPLAGDFLALTYNVAGLPEGISGSHPETNTPLISPRLNAYDLVLVQESWQTPDPNPLAPLRVYHELLVADALHPYKSNSMPLPLGADPRRPSALVSDGLNQFAQFPFDPDLVREMWTNCHASAADCLSLKGFSMSRVSLARGVTVDVYNLHGEAGGDPEDDQLRDDGVTQLADFIVAHSAGRALIVGGDFNLHTDEEPDQTSFARLLSLTGTTDACAAVACPQIRIDKFLFRSSDTLAIDALSWSNDDALFQDGAGEPLSDHDPVAVRFAWSVGP
jgi:hypothetical protein